jgi:hypothetical protein
MAFEASKSYGIAALDEIWMHASDGARQVKNSTEPQTAAIE